MRYYRRINRFAQSYFFLLCGKFFQLPDSGLNIAIGHFKDLFRFFRCDAGQFGDNEQCPFFQFCVSRAHRCHEITCDPSQFDHDGSRDHVQNHFLCGTGFHPCGPANHFGTSRQIDEFFCGKTDEELSLVCITSDVPMHTTDRHDGWRGFRIEGEVDDQVCEVSSLSSALIGSHIDILSVSTFNTDYILVRGDELSRAVAVLEDKGYMVQ